MARSTFIYVTYIRTTPEKLWSALTDPEAMKQYWFGCRCESQWTAGAPWKLVHPDGHVLESGEVVEAVPPRRLVVCWRHHDSRPELEGEGPAMCEMALEPSGAAIKLTITHSIEREHSKLIESVSGGWPKVLSNLKSMLETGEAVMQDPYPAPCNAASA